MSDAFAGGDAGFVPGLSTRRDAAAAALLRAFPAPREAASFVVADPGAGPPARRGAGPRHFHPADPSARPTAGWNPLDPHVPTQDAGSRIDPLEAAHAAGYAEGMAAAIAAARADDTRDAGLLIDLARGLGEAGRLDRDALARALRQTVMTLVTGLVGEIGVSGELLARRVEAAVRCLADKAEAALLRVNPDDLPLLDGHLPATVFAAGDAAVTRGAFVLETASTVVEDGPDLWLDQLAHAIDLVPLPAAG